MTTNRFNDWSARQFDPGFDARKEREDELDRLAADERHHESVARDLDAHRKAQDARKRAEAREGRSLAPFKGELTTAQLQDNLALSLRADPGLAAGTNQQLDPAIFGQSVDQLRTGIASGEQELRNATYEARREALDNEFGRNEK